MQPNEALAYLTQVCNDYARTLPPSAAMPFQQVAQDAVTSLAQALEPPPEQATERPPLRAVGPDAE
jgi:hypothetical protein